MKRAPFEGTPWPSQPTPTRRFCKPRFTPSTSPSAPAWCPSPATTCRCNIPTGILTEHNWTREHAGLFDVSHMGQAFLIAEDKSHETVARALEALVPADVLNLKPNQQRYSQLLAEDGGILDDLMVTRVGAPGHEGWLYLVVNASMKDADYAHIQARLPKGVTLNPQGRTARSWRCRDRPPLPCSPESLRRTRPTCPS